MDPADLLLKAAAPQDPRLGRPFVTLSYAQSLDGSIAARSGRPLALSGPESMTLTHSQRACHDAILVGIGTVLADNPRLTVRLVAGRDPQTVIMDSRLRFPPYAELLRHGRSPWIATAQEADSQRLEALETAGARVFRLPSADGWVDLVSLLKLLSDLGIHSLMVEGGARVITSFLVSRLVDQMVLTIAPWLVGGLRVVDHLGAPPICRAFPACTT